MNSTQRLIKYCAMAFAIVLAVGIISGAANILFAVVDTVQGKQVGYFSNEKENPEQYDVLRSFEGVKSIDIDHAMGKVTIKAGASGFSVRANHVSKNFVAEVDKNGSLSVYDRGRNARFLWFDINGLSSANSDITIYVPSDFVADEVKIRSGAGSVTLDGIKSEYLYVEAGAGKIAASGIWAKKVKWEGGVGSSILEELYSQDAYFDCGVGTLEISGTLLGKTKIDCGVGKVTLDLKGSTEEYGYDVDSGIGKITLNGEKISGKHNSFAKNMLQVDGGIGMVEIKIH